MGYTKFGKKIRKYMIDNDENLGSLAVLFDVSTAFVSAVLIGKKPVPDGWYEILSDHYGLNEQEKKELYDDYVDTKNSVKIDISNAETQKKKLALQFQRKFPVMTQEELDSIFNILEKEKKNGL